MADPSSTPRRPPFFRSRSVRFEFFRNLAFGGIFLVVLVGSIWLLPRVAKPDQEVQATEDTAPETTLAPVDDPGAEGSGRYQPTTLSAEHIWTGSREEVIPADPAARVAAVALGRVGADGVNLDAIAVLKAAELGATPSAAFDPDALPSEPVELVEGLTGQLFQRAEDPVIRIAWVTEAGRRLELATRGISLGEAVQIAGSTVVIEPPPVAPGEPPGVPNLNVLQQAGLDLLAGGALPTGETTRVTDNFAVPGSTAGSISVTHVQPAGGFEPYYDAVEPTTSLVRVGDHVAVWDGALRWEQDDDLVLEVSGVGASVGELADIAAGLEELTVNQLNSRRPPTLDVIPTTDGRPGPSPAFDLAPLGARNALDVGAVENDPPPPGQLVGPVRIVGRLEGSDIDLYHWDRGDGVYAECVGANGTGIEAVFCLSDGTALNGAHELGAYAITDGPLAGSRLMVFRVASRVAVVSAAPGGVALWQQPVDGVAAFVVPGQDRLTVTAYDVDGAPVRTAPLPADEDG
jgi:hypothetical protein